MSEWVSDDPTHTHPFATLTTGFKLLDMLMWQLGGSCTLHVMFGMSSVKWGDWPHWSINLVHVVFCLDLVAYLLLILNELVWLLNICFCVSLRTVVWQAKIPQLVLLLLNATCTFRHIFVNFYLGYVLIFFLPWHNSQERTLALAENRPLPALYSCSDIRPLKIEDFRYAHEQVWCFWKFAFMVWCILGGCDEVYVLYISLGCVVCLGAVRKCGGRPFPGFLSVSISLEVP